jgi:YidC/Oxa1 family membrane protein insertase
MLNFLAQSSTYLGYGVKAVTLPNLDPIGLLIKMLIEGIGMVGVGIIVFTLILKTIVLPLDIYSRIKTKKQALIMEKMRPQMEKLQKQYANDKNLYNQKVMELQKSSGYSVFGACLPMVVSLIIFIIVFQSFSTYTQYANAESYNGMVNAYNGVVASFVLDEDNQDGFLIEESLQDSDGNTVKDYKVDFSAFASYYNTQKSLTLTQDEVFTTLMNEYKAKYTDVYYAEGIENQNTEAGEAAKIMLVRFYIEEPAAQAAADYYRSHKNNTPFVWIGNLWYPDSMLNNEVPTFSKFQSTISKSNVDDSYAEAYEKVTAGLSQEKQTYNGYFVLIVCSIGFMLLQQFISMRSNKSTNELTTVDGSGAKTTKYMMIAMPVIYGIFAFFYSASFSIYMTTNTIYSIITTLIINKAVNVWFNKKENKEENQKLLNNRKK